VGAAVRTAQDFTHWQLAPDLVSDDEHRELCQVGYVEVQEGLYAQMLRCPVCSYRTELEKTRAAIERSGIGARYWGLEWDDLETPDPLPRLRDSCGRIGEIIAAGHSLVLTGGPGGGKTQCAVLAIKAAIRAGHTAHLDNLGRLSVEVRESYSGDGGLSEAGVVRHLSGVDLLVLDDLGAGETANAEVERRVLYLVLETRQNAAKPTIVTTNLTQGELARTVGARILNRLQPMATVEFRHGKNFRLNGQEEVLW
jgi:DNA replication protein DnaC